MNVTLVRVSCYIFSPGVTQGRRETTLIGGGGGGGGGVFIESPENAIFIKLPEFCWMR